MRFRRQTAPLILLATTFNAVAVGQIRTDGTVGAARTFTGRSVTLPAALGTQRGGNLFHSFSDFNIARGQTVTFTGDATRVLARVTGGRPSSIDGTLASSVRGASLYFINPAGVVIGPNATIDVSGSFVVSTADYVALGVAGRFDAAAPERSVLSSAAPTAFGFLSTNPGSIAVRGRLLPPENEGDPESPAFIDVGDQKSISLIGGNTSIASRGLGAPGGRLNVVAVAGVGEVTLDPEAPAGTIAITNPGRSNVGVYDLSILDITGDTGGGAIQINGGKVTVDSSQISAQATSDVPGGSIAVDADVLRVTNNSLIGTAAVGAAGGDISLNARAVLLSSGAAVFAATYADATGGSIRVRADALLRVDGGAAISTDNEGPNAGGLIDVHAGRIELDGTGSVDLATGILSETGLTADERAGFDGDDGTFDVGVGGRINVVANSLSIIDGAQMSAVSYAAGDAGSVRIKANALKIDGVTFPDFTGIAAQTLGGPVGPGAQALIPQGGAGGSIKVNAKRIDIVRGGGISADTFGNGPAGRVDVTANTLIIDGAGAPLIAGRDGTPEPVNTGINAKTGETGFDKAPITGGGPGGDLILNVRDLLRVADATVRTNTNTDAPAGEMQISAGRIEITRTAASMGTDVGIGADVEPGATGHGGSITAVAGTVDISGGARLTVDAFGPGDAGTLNLTTGDLQLSTDGRIEAASEYLERGNYTTGPLGRGGDVNVRSTGDMKLTTGGRITSRAVASDAGNIQINLPGTLQIDGGQISTEAQLAGGSISVGRTPIGSTPADGGTDGGAATGGNTPAGVVAPQYLILGSSARITANAVQAAGGNIAIGPSLLILSADSAITATSQQAAPGTIEIGGNIVDLTSSIVAIDVALMNRNDLLRYVCGTTMVSSFTVQGKGGVTAGTTEYLGTP